MSEKKTFVPGQRWNSLTEPELGLGVVDLVEGRQVVVRYPAREVTRRYETSDAPLVRARLSPGQMAQSVDGRSFRVEFVDESDYLLTYRSADAELVEVDLDPHLDVVTPENRLRGGQLDPHPLFDLRREALQIRHDMLALPARGFLGGRIRLFDHQLSIARDVCERHRIRVLLADEVGLGKTIEALLVLHRMLLTGRVDRALILVPPALIHQWLAEAYLRFNLVLRVLGRDSVDSRLTEPEPDPEAEALAAQLRNSQLCICPLDEDGSEVLREESFDMLIVDEAHHLVPGSTTFELVGGLAAQIDHVLILSATPDRDGEAAHFARLALLDPARFHDIDQYRAEAEHYGALADAAERLQRGEELREQDRQLLAQRLAIPDLDELVAKSTSEESARRELLGRLLDLHGIGRVMFRNVRARIPGFPRRVHDPVVLPDGDPAPLCEEFRADLHLAAPIEMLSARQDPRCRWLRKFLREHPDQRVLALCSTKDKVEAFAKAIEGPGRKVARFHEDMSSIQRDRQAAGFLAADGPQLLVSSAIGAEGRNFQVARHLVLLDLPATPDRLEQLIGRVDRIGQGEEVFLHTPVLAGTPQACMARWYAALGIFERPWHGSPVIDREFGESILLAAAAVAEAEVDALIERGRQRNAEIISELEGGRDRLLELTSFDLDAAHQLSDAIASAHEDDQLEQFMVFAFERAGLKVERIDYRSYAVHAGVDYHRPFPGFIGPEMGFTFDRAIALQHPERGLLTFDHPMVRDTIDSLLAHEAGNASVARLPLRDQQGLLLEALFVAEPTVARSLRADRFFPPSPIRIVIDARGREVGLDAAKVQPLLKPADAALLRHESVMSRLQPLQERARAIAVTKGPAVVAAARAQMQRELAPAVTRLENLVLVNPSDAVRAELAAARRELQQLDAGLKDFRIRLDALRVILMVPAGE